MKLSKESKRFITLIHNSTAIPEATIKDVFKNIFAQMIISLENSDTMELPYIGSFKFVYEGDRIVKKGKQAIVSAEITPSDYFLKNIGQIKDKVESDAERDLRKQVEDAIGEILYDDKAKVR